MTTECVNVSYDLAFPDGDWDCYVYSILYFFDDENAFNSWDDDLRREKELMDILFGLFFKSCSLPLNEPLVNLIPFFPPCLMVNAYIEQHRVLSWSI